MRWTIVDHRVATHMISADFSVLGPVSDESPVNSMQFKLNSENRAVLQ